MRLRAGVWCPVKTRSLDALHTKSHSLSLGVKLVSAAQKEPTLWRQDVHRNARASLLSHYGAGRRFCPTSLGNCPALKQRYLSVSQKISYYIPIECKIK